MRRNGFVYLLQGVLTALIACSSADRPAQPPVEGVKRLTTENRPSVDRFCQQIVWKNHNNNRYIYRFDANRRLIRCVAIEQTNSYGTYTLDQQLTYTKEGLLDRVYDGEDASQYRYRNGRLASIDFFQSERAVYRYLVATNEQGMITKLRGMPLNDSGLLAYSTRYQLDGQGHYVQLDVEDDRGVLFYRVKHRDFVPVDGHPNESMAGLPYELNRNSWVNWWQLFPINHYLAGRVEMFRYAAPETPTELIKRTEQLFTWQRDKQGRITGQFSTDALTTLRDTSVIDYINCH